MFLSFFVDYTVTLTQKAKIQPVWGQEINCKDWGQFRTSNIQNYHLLT